MLDSCSSFSRRFSCARQPARRKRKTLFAWNSGRDWGGGGADNKRWVGFGLVCFFSARSFSTPLTPVYYFALNNKGNNSTQMLVQWEGTASNAMEWSVSSSDTAPIFGGSSRQLRIGSLSSKGYSIIIYFEVVSTWYYLSCILKIIRL